jgi:hypothetical protein
MTAPQVASQTRTGPDSPQRSHIAQDDKAAIESLQTSATAGPITGNAASRTQPNFEQLSLANIFVLHRRTVAWSIGLLKGAGGTVSA